MFKILPLKIHLYSIHRQKIGSFNNKKNFLLYLYLLYVMFCSSLDALLKEEEHDEEIACSLHSSIAQEYNQLDGVYRTKNSWTSLPLKFS